jgi:heptosyltransferase-2
MIEKPNKILIIQTAFIGDTILASSVAEEVHYYFPNAEIYLLVKKGNEGIYENHPFLKIITHDKSQKLSSLWRLIKFIWSEKFDTIINLHRYFSSHF